MSLDWIDRFDTLAAMAPEDRARLAGAARLVTLPPEARVFGPGDAADALLLLVSGVVRVQHQSDTGRQIVLYRIRAGESCVLTTACLMAQEAYSAEGITETQAEAVAVPRGAFDALIAASPDFRAFVFGSYARRISDLFLLIDSVAFRRIDIRLAQRLLALADEAGQISATHQALATELGTAREVVSRQLQEFRRRGMLALARGRVEITDAVALQRLAAQE